ncbi:hypothetical protein BC833DRAFT_616460 [Globomyces pollinis-pini]|nr:hypothetical protein BC833DRAFT_616460 [Globomyces pollinis-pini]
MVRGHAKAEAKLRVRHYLFSNIIKNAKNAPKEAKSQLGSARTNALKYVCPACKSGCPNHKTLSLHMESKHPGVPIPPDLNQK